MKTFLKLFGSVLSLLLSFMLIRTFTFGEAAVEVKSVPLLEIHEKSFAERFAGGLRIPTVAYTDRSKMDPTPNWPSEIFRHDIPASSVFHTPPPVAPK